jgi:poly(3-hydroxybutyrate) depolymerase
MLYQIYDAQRSMLEPFADWAHAASKLFTTPVSPLSHMPGADRIAAGYELFYRLGKDYVKPAFGLHTITIDGVDVAIH